MLTWKEKTVPGRPTIKRIVAQYRLSGSSHQWLNYYITPADAAKSRPSRRRRRRSATGDAPMGTTIRPEDLQGDNVDDLEFQVVAESSEGVLSDAEKPTVVFTGTC